MPQYLLAIDQGTTSNRVHIFTREGKLISTHRLFLQQTYPERGWVEQNPEEIWSTTLECCHQAINKNNILVTDIAAIGIANQRETTIMWDKKTSRPIYPAISWQDRRTAKYCETFAEHIIAKKIPEKTGLILDPYFSATKIAWLLNNVPDARKRAKEGELLFGTIDTFLLWRLTNGKIHATDATNASRTMLFNISTQIWDQEILDCFDIPHQILPNVLDSSANFGSVDKKLLGHEIPITSMIGDQQAALVGQVCFEAGMIKSTYGTGCFAVLNTGKKLVKSTNRLLSTVAYRLQNEVTYGLEGSIFSAGSIVKWLRDGLHLIKTPDETEILAKTIADTKGVYLLPAFAGLGAPYWDPHARAAIVGLTFGSGQAHIARAALEAVAYQTRDLMNAMTLDYPISLLSMRVDGGMSVNNWFLQFLADMVALKIDRPECTETTALGAAFLAGLQVGMYQSLAEISTIWQRNKEFIPAMKEDTRAQLWQGWQAAIKRIL